MKKTIMSLFLVIGCLISSLSVGLPNLQNTNAEQLIMSHFPTATNVKEKKRIIAEVQQYCKSKNYFDIATCLNTEDSLKNKLPNCACFGVVGYNHWGAKACVIC